MTMSAHSMTRWVRVAALLLIACLIAGPMSTHIYWMLGGTWGLHRSVGGHIEQSTSTGIRVVATIVVALLIAAAFVVLARVGLWRQTLVPDKVIRFLAWVIAVIFLLETLASLTWSRQYEWWLYAPASLVIALLALVVAGSDDAWPRVRRPHRMLRSH
jgi:cytochrome bd-type quinol oxidase subunit 2